MLRMSYKEWVPLALFIPACTTGTDRSGVPSSPSEESGVVTSDGTAAEIRDSGASQMPATSASEVLATPPSTGPQLTVPDVTPLADAGALEASCSRDEQCLTGFCDRTQCAEVIAQHGIGGICGPVPIGPAGVVFSPLDFCPYLCVDGRCRSCLSAEECYEQEGYLACSPAGDGRPGYRCTGPTTDGTWYEPPVLPQQQGTALSVVDSACALSELRLSVGVADPTWQRPRLAVLWWHQRVGEADEFMQLAYDEPFPGTPDISIPLTQIALPYEENLICERDCRARDRCNCRGTPAIALASIIVAQDTDGDGSLSLAEIQNEQVGGVPEVLVGWSQVADDETPRGWSGYLASTQRGMCPYPVGDINGTESLLAPATSTEQVFELRTCPAASTGCTFGVPEVFCLWERCEQERGLNRFGLGPVTP